MKNRKNRNESNRISQHYRIAFKIESAPKESILISVSIPSPNQQVCLFVCVLVCECMLFIQVEIYPGGGVIVTSSRMQLKVCSRHFYSSSKEEHISRINLVTIPKSPNSVQYCQKYRTDRYTAAGVITRGVVIQYSASAQISELVSGGI